MTYVMARCERLAENHRLGCTSAIPPRFGADSSNRRASQNDASVSVRWLSNAAVPWFVCMNSLV